MVKEAAILIESGAYLNMDKIILMVSQKSIRINRVFKRDNSDLMSIENITTEIYGADVVHMEMCCIRCENVMSKYSWCSKAGSPVIFCGYPMSFTNPSKDFYTFEVNRDILNSSNQTETKFLTHLENLINKKTTNADHMINKFSKSENLNDLYDK